MSKIAKLYIPLIQDFNISSIDMFRDKFLQRMSRENFHDTLRAYGIVPHQHKLKWVLEGFNTMKSSTNEATQEKPSSQYLSIIQDKIALIERRIIRYSQELKTFEGKLLDEQAHPTMTEKRLERIHILKQRIQSLKNQLKEQDRLKSRAEFGL